jgi:hypothetical protein
MPKMPLKGTAKQKMKQAMHEAKSGQMHSGSKNGPVVTDKKQQIAIALAESGLSSKKKKRKKRA